MSALEEVGGAGEAASSSSSSSSSNNIIASFDDVDDNDPHFFAALERHTHVVVEGQKPRDIEDLYVLLDNTVVGGRTPLQRHRARRPMRVTDLCAQAWCEAALHAGLEVGVRSIDRAEADAEVKAAADAASRAVAEASERAALAAATKNEVDLRAAASAQIRATAALEAASSAAREVALREAPPSAIGALVAPAPSASVSAAARASRIARRRGTERHTQLELETHEVVKVAADTREDALALTFVTMLTCARELVEHGATREMPVLGAWSGVWLSGVIDAIQCSQLVDGGAPRLSDTKTRVAPSEPGVASKRGARLQMLVYKWLFDSLAQLDVAALATYLKLDMARPLSAQVGAAAEAAIGREVQFEDAEAGTEARIHTLKSVSTTALAVCAALPRSSNTLTVEYESQVDRALIARDTFPFDELWLRTDVDHFVQYWHGTRTEPAVVPHSERWKCRFCAYHDICRRSPLERPSAPDTNQPPQAELVETIEEE